MITIDRVKIEEIPEVKQLLRLTWEDTYGGFLSPQIIEQYTSVSHDPKLLIQQAEDKNTFFGVAKSETGKIVGLATVQRIDDELVMMHRLYIHPGFQRQ